MKPDKAIHGLYVIADTGIIVKDLEQAVAAAIEGGARVVQYRDKNDDDTRRLHEAMALCGLCRQHDVTFIVNDDVELAKLCGADGVHLGKDDTAIKFARSQLGDRSIIGVSCYDELARAGNAVAAGASYVAFGSFYASAVKPDAVRASGSLLSQAKQELSVPIVAIGGITPENGARLVAAGADALAVISDVFDSDDIRVAAEQYARLFNNQ